MLTYADEGCRGKADGERERAQRRAEREYQHNRMREAEEAQHLAVLQALSLLALLVQKYKY